MTLDVVWVETLTGAVYRFPDVPPGHMNKLMDQLRDQVSPVVILNVSEAALTIPRHIIKEVGVVGREQPLWARPTAPR